MILSLDDLRGRASRYAVILLGLLVAAIAVTRQALGTGGWVEAAVMSLITAVVWLEQTIPPPLRTSLL